MTTCWWWEGAPHPGAPCRPAAPGPCPGGGPFLAGTLNVGCKSGVSPSKNVQQCVQQSLVFLNHSCPGKNLKMHPFSKVSLYSHLNIPSASNWSHPLYFLNMLGLPLRITPIRKFSIHVCSPFQTPCLLIHVVPVSGTKEVLSVFHRSIFGISLKVHLKIFHKMLIPWKCFLFVARLLGLLLGLPISESSNAEQGGGLQGIRDTQCLKWDLFLLFDRTLVTVKMSYVCLTCHP